MKMLNLIVYILVLFCSYSTYAAQRPIAKPLAINIITDENGMKLYVLEFDSNHEVNCYGDCNREWPEIQVENKKRTKGDSGPQLTLNNKPVSSFDQESQTTKKGTEREINVWRIISPQ